MHHTKFSGLGGGGGLKFSLLLVGRSWQKRTLFLLSCSIKREPIDPEKQPAKDLLQAINLALQNPIDPAPNDSDSKFWQLL